MYSEGLLNHNLCCLLELVFLMNACSQIHSQDYQCNNFYYLQLSRIIIHFARMVSVLLNHSFMHLNHKYKAKSSQMRREDHHLLQNKENSILILCDNQKDLTAFQFLRRLIFMEMISCQLHTLLVRIKNY